MTPADTRRFRAFAGDDWRTLSWHLGDALADWLTYWAFAPVLGKEITLEQAMVREAVLASISKLAGEGSKRGSAWKACTSYVHGTDGVVYFDGEAAVDPDRARAQLGFFSINLQE